MNYNFILSNLSDQLDDSLDVNHNNEREVLDSLTLTYKIRHNAIHYLVAYMITRDMTLFNEKPLSYYFGDKLDRVNRKKTPDICLLLDKYNTPTKKLDDTVRILLIDISISSTSNLQREVKIMKYENAAEQIRSRFGIDCNVHSVAVNSDFSNLEYEIEDLKNLINPFIDTSTIPYTDFRLFLKTLIGVQSKLKDFIMNEELVKNFFQQEFGGEKIPPDEGKIEDIIFERLPKLFKLYDKKKKINTTSDLKRKECEDYFESMRNKTGEEKSSMLNEKLDQYTQLLKELTSDEEVRQKFLEKETASDKVEVSIQELKFAASKFQPFKIKPTHQIFSPICCEQYEHIMDHEVEVCLRGFLPEQKQIFLLLKLFSKKCESLPSWGFINNIYNNMYNIFTGEFSEINKHMFNNNTWYDDEEDSIIKEKYTRYRESCLRNRTPILSSVEYMRQKLKIQMPRDNESRSYKQKMVKIPHNGWDDLATEWWKKAHSGFKEEKKVKMNKVESSCQFEHSVLVDDFLDLLTEDNNLPSKNFIYDFITASESSDASSFKFLKKEMTKETKPILKELMKLNGFQYLWNQSLIAEQLMHFTQFSLPSNTFSFFTCGIPNILYIVNNSYHDAGKDVGKAYMCIGYVYDKRWLTSFFGKIDFISKFDPVKKREIHFFQTNWRRTETFKLTFLKDQFYSVMSTSMNALLRYREDIIMYKRGAKDKDYTFSLIRHHFSLKVCVSLTSNQRIAEMLSDMRYAIMASFSDYSEIDQLILDKFKPKYSTAMEAWIASRTEFLKRQIIEFKDNHNLRTFFKQPVFVRGRRKDNSIGGTFELPSIWTGTIIKDLQDLLDDMFLYVHTLKDPSNIHHENIKAIETILEYQKKYDNLSERRKMGNMETFDEYKTFLIDDNPIGHSSDIVKISSHLTLQTLKAFDLNLHAKKHFFEKVSNITSTKAAIPEYEREIIPIELSKRQKSKLRKQNTKDIDPMKLTREKKEFISDYEKMSNSKLRPKLPKSIRTAVTKESFLPNTNRSKVHDCILDVLENNLDMSSVFDVAEWNINLNNSRVVSDICIKAQYGAKREFYVINVGAKCNARILENIFSEICKALPNEMISVPGDKKMLVMQDFLNDFLIKKGVNQQVIFVNGDCTKWSAAETMECFMSLISGMEGFLEENILKYLLIVVDMWANKQITIPISILQKTFFTIDGKTDYLNRDEPVLNSTQNFLQGMFNYMSSFKAVCSSNFTRTIWKKLYPMSKLEMNHLEHSDDYSLIMLSESLEEAREFRLLHRIIMKMHGFNDSIKKTNTQRFLMEFISLVSLNGHMTYPHIKKLKECGMNLGCTGFRDDVDGAMSRVGECVRVGSVMSSAYFMQKMHLANVARSYSILPGQRNSVTSNVRNLFELPVEIFGLPDVHPILSFLTKGLANNYRLLKFSDSKRLSDLMDIGHDSMSMFTVKDLLTLLMKIQSLKETSNSSLVDDDFTKGVRLYHPGYIFDIENNLIKKLKKSVRITPEEVIAFWDNHKTYNFIKPQNRNLLVTWMRSMYYKHNFALAYSRNSRAQITMRLSTFTSKNCCIIGKDKNDEFILKSIRDYVKIVLSCLKDDTNLYNAFSIDTNYKVDEVSVNKTLERAVLNCDSSITTIYSMMKNAKIIPEGEHTRSTVASLTPNKVNWLNINNQPDAVLQYIFNFDDFILDNRKNKGLPSLESDKKQIVKFYGHDLNQQSPIDTIKSVYTDIILSRSKKNLCMTYNSNIQNLEDFIKVHIEFGSVYQFKYNVYTAGATESINPHTGEIYYKKLHTFVRNEYRMMIDDAVLIFALLTQAYKVEYSIVRRVLNNIRVKSEYIIDKDNKIDSHSLWNNISIQDLRTMGCSNNELKSFAFLKNFVTGDIEDIYYIINQDFSYMYQYKYVKNEYNSLVKEIVEFVYMKTFFRCVLFKNEHVIIMTNDRKKMLLTDAYMIGLKLLNKIKLYELEKNFGSMTLRDVQKNTLSKGQIGFFIEHKDQLFRFLDEQSMIGVQIMNENQTTRLNILDSKDYVNSISLNDNLFSSCKFFVISHGNDIESSNTDYINKHVRIDFNTMSVFNGRRKVFGLPVMSCQQSNTVEVVNDLDLNGLSLNWWLDNKRIKKLITQDDIIISKEEFDAIVNFYMKNDKVLLCANVINLIDKMKSLPQRFLDKLPDETLNEIERRMFKNVSETNEDMTAFNFLQRTSLKSANPKSVEELEESSGKIDLLENDTFNDSSSDFNAEDLDFDIDMDDVLFEEVQEDSDDEIEDEIIKIANDQSDESTSSKESLIHFNDFQFIVPTLQENDVIIVNSTRTKSLLESIGDPTQYVIQKMYANTTHMDFLTSREKAGLLYRLNDILVCAPMISDVELLMTLTLANNLIKSFGKNEEWVLYEDYVLEQNDDGCLDIFLRYEGILPLDQEERLKAKGGRIKYNQIRYTNSGKKIRSLVNSEIISKLPAEQLEKYYLIPLAIGRKKEVLEHCCKRFTIDKFLGVNHIYDCYSRLYKESFTRGGFVLEILNELF